MISNKILLICLAFIALTACSPRLETTNESSYGNEKRTLVGNWKPPWGNITVALYNDTETS